MRRIALLIIALAACDSSSRTPPPPGPSDPPDDPSPTTQPAREGAAAVRGVVRFQGEHTPAPLSIQPECHHEGNAFSEAILLNPDKTLRNVLVYVKTGLAGKYEPPPTPGWIDQKRCIYTPHVQVVMVGQPLKFINSDDVLHNVRITARRNPNDQFSMTRGERAIDPFKYSEVDIRVNCDVHSWMSARIHVMRHPKFALTGDGGTFEIRGLPAGSYTLAAFHEELGEQTREIVLTEGQIVEGLEVAFKR